jgi:hypothetical protein
MYLAVKITQSAIIYYEILNQEPTLTQTERWILQKSYLVESTRRSVRLYQ